MRSLNGVAVDAGGAVYVYERVNNRISKFSPDGEFLLMFGGEVNKSTGANVCTAEDLNDGDECGIGVLGDGAGQLGSAAVGTDLQVGAGGTILVGDKARILEFNADGSFKGTVTGPLLSGKIVGDMVMDSTGNFYATLKSTDLGVNLNDVAKLAPNGATGVPPSFGPVERPGSLAIDPEGNLYVASDPPIGAESNDNPRILKFDPAGNKLIPSPEEEENGEFFAQMGGASINGLATLLCHPANAPGALYVAYGDGQIVGYGRNPGCEEDPVGDPEINAQYATAVGITSAQVQAEIDPNHQPAATYYVEYGLGDCETNLCATEPAPPGVPLGDTGTAAVTTAPVELSGLEPGTTYHYRFVAVGEDESGNPVVVKGEGETSEGKIFTTYREGAGGLPNDRAYEMVSPVDKDGGQAAPRGATENRFAQVSADGEAVSYTSVNAFADPEGAPATSFYLSRRGGEGWSTQNITPPDQSGAALEPSVRALSSDLSKAVLVASQPPLCCGATPGVQNLYLLDTESGELRLLTEEAPVLGIPASSYRIRFGGASNDFRRIFFAAMGSLTEDAPPGTGGWNLYEWSEGPGLRLASVLPDEQAAPPAENTGFGTGGSEAGLSLTHNAISEDGSRAVWTFSGSFEGASSPLFDRIGGVETVQLDEDAPGPAGGGRYWGASEDGSVVFFTDAPSSGSSLHLYRYDFDAPPGAELISLTGTGVGAQVEGVVGSAEDGSRAYFVAKSVLAAGAEAGGNNLYLWQEGQPLRFIETLNSTGGEPPDLPAWDSASQSRSARVSPDGRHLAFLSVEPLTGQDTIGQPSGTPTKQLYLYDAVTDELVCASCNPSGARPLGSAVLTAWAVSTEFPRHLSADGGRVFFESFDKLDVHDTNGVRDVYQFERSGHGACTPGSRTYNPKSEGCLSLISSGNSTEDSYFLGASLEGEDVFISTSERLFGGDVDELYDAYDARIGGGFPPPEGPPGPCVGEACKLAFDPPPSPPAPPTSGFRGDGNLQRDCSPLAKRAKQLAKNARRLSRKATKADAAKAKRRLARKAKRVGKQGRKARGKAKQCRFGGEGQATPKGARR